VGQIAAVVGQIVAVVGQIAAVVGQIVVVPGQIVVVVAEEQTAAFVEKFVSVAGEAQIAVFGLEFAVVVVVEE